MISLQILSHRNILQTKTHLTFPISFGPFNSILQKRWKKPIDSAQTRLENRTRDTTLDKLMANLKKLKIILQIHQLMTDRKRGPFVSVQLMSRWTNVIGLNVTMGTFLRKYPHVFEVFTHPVRRNLCCRLTCKMRDLISEEEGVVKECELDAVRRVKKLLMMSNTGRLQVHALRLIRRELGLPEDFRESILGKFAGDFRLLDLETVELVDTHDDDDYANLGVAAVEKWREKEYTEKWLSEFETRFAFPINFPTGYKIEAGFRGKLRNWQRLPYLKPYERKEVVRVRTCGGIERFEKRAVGIIHELLNLTVEKMVEVERLAHFRKDYGMVVNVRELLLKHPGIFYISTKGTAQTVFLREAFSKGCLIEPNPIYVVRQKILDLMLLGCRNTRELRCREVIKEGSDNVVGQVDREIKKGSDNVVGTRDGDWAISILEGFGGGNPSDNLSQEFH
ncbi:PORR domain-containing protein [Cephalotus follicularis]|uniref:PORR domain-containing protein n=1 Tax=Cephalotus follicularis TaxID=3775 RepID=A0A1Q3AX10_CEPFO|nr:PORR domain-containing protein [Cephalotus follicularis]